MAQESPTLTRMDEDRCASLRWKGMFIAAEWDPAVQRCNDRAFWCQKTQIPLGPDGAAVDEYECHDGRRCYNPL